MSLDQDPALPAVHAHPLSPVVQLPEDWSRLLQVHDDLGDITLACWQGRPQRDLEVTAQGPVMFCIGIFLEGQAWMALDGGPPLQAGPGTAVVQTAQRPVSGSFGMRGGNAIRLVDIRFTLEGLERAGGRPLLALQGGFLQDCSVPGSDSLMGGFPAPPELLRVATDVLGCRFEDDVVRTLYLRAKALEALAIVLGQLQAAGQGPARVAARERQRVLQARALLDARFGEEWPLERLAREVGLGEKRLQAGFRALVGTSVHGHLREVRLQAAGRMLHGGHSVTDTALAVGFSSLSHFSKAFRTQMGCTPRAWQRGEGAGPESGSDPFRSAKGL